MRVLVALGGNALLPRGVAPDAATQIDHIDSVAPVLARLAQEHQVVIAHGNGPQVGMLALESDGDASLTRPYPLDALVAETQGMVGYWVQRALRSAGLTAPAVTLVTQTLVDPHDPAFAAPTKFVGAGYDEVSAQALASSRGWTFGRDGHSWRRTVPSPIPLEVLEAGVVTTLLDAGVTVIAAGGGGCPVARAEGRLVGVEAVVDKDLVATSLALAIDADLLVLATDVPGVFANWGTPHEELLVRVKPARVAELALAPGTMGPKVDAACRFANATGRSAVIGALEDLADLVTDRAGTHVVA